jgi:hypothetical protein
MSKICFAGLVAASAVVALAAPASACPAGYVAGWVQGNKVCHIKPGGNNQFKANVGPEQKGKQRALVSQQKNIRASQRTFE